MNDKIVTIGIPAYHALNTISNLLASVQIQTMRKYISVIIANDDPQDAGKYQFVRTLYPDIDITILETNQNTGPGLARQRALDAADTPWITFIDADDVLYSPYAIESLINNTSHNIVQVQASFLQQIEEGNIPYLDKQHMIQSGQNIPPRLIANNSVYHPWVFGRLYNVSFLRQNGISFSRLRAMEDAQFNHKIRLTIEGSRLQINVVQEPVYVWKTGSQHSITRIGIKENNGIPLYNWDLCQVGAIASAINAISFCRKKNPFNGNITRFSVEQMIGTYFTYVQCLQKRPMFAPQCWFNAKRFYHSAYKCIENQIDEAVLKDMYTSYYANNAQDMIGVIPKITFFEFMNKIKNEPYKGKDEFDEIRESLPDWVRDLDKKSGVLGEQGYVYTEGEV